jgi:hypothetical protein
MSTTIAAAPSTDAASSAPTNAPRMYQRAYLFSQEIAEICDVNEPLVRQYFRTGVIPAHWRGPEG